ncbi:MAG: oligoendopeptidase F, partial [Candidatus Electrothrix sp. EH2]|nr:oligoendopeptidase F [Candidatus Electrothrix sp. EH2]
MSTERNTELGTAEVLWNLRNLYEAPDDEMIQEDLDFCHQEAKLIQEHRGKLAELEAPAFARTVRRLERIQATL